MTNPNQLVISEQSRKLAEVMASLFSRFKLHQHEEWVQDGAVKEIQLLLNSQREAITRECAEEARKCKNENATTEYAKGTLNGHIWARHNILAKLQNK